MGRPQLLRNQECLGSILTRTSLPGWEWWLLSFPDVGSHFPLGDIRKKRADGTISLDRKGCFNWIRDSVSYPPIEAGTIR